MQGISVFMVDIRSEKREVQIEKRKDPRLELHCEANIFGLKGIQTITDISLGGIFIEVLGDVAAGLAPLTKNETEYLLKRLKGYKLIEGYRGQNGVNQKLFIDIVQRIGQLVRIAPEIVELDLNPLIGFGDKICAVDARIKIDREITPVVYKRDMEKSVH